MSSNPSHRLTYAASGVDIELANQTKKRIKGLVRSTFGPEVLTDIGSFGGLFAYNWRELEAPVLVSSTDSVGTKLKLAFMMDKHDTVGMDLVFHCANDILAQGARPLFFMDYIALGKHLPRTVEQLITGLVQACKELGCALLGGEMAELPDIYQAGEYDLAGTIVGVVERNHIVDGTARIQAGDRLVGLHSSGLHTNGYTLARRALFAVAKYGVDSLIVELGTTLGEALLEPHRCYGPLLLPLINEGLIKGLAHITGGGLPDNVARILPDNCTARIDTTTWEVPVLFRLIQRCGQVAEQEMVHVFNMGIGMVVVVAAQEADRVLQRLVEAGEQALVIGEVTSGHGEVVLA